MSERAWFAILATLAGTLVLVMLVQLDDVITRNVAAIEELREGGCCRAPR